MPSENTILNLFRRLFSFFNNSTSHYRLRTWRQKAARFRLPKHIMVEHSRPDGLVSRYEYDSYDPLAQVCNWTSMSTVRRGCITTSSGIMSLMQGGLIRIWLGWMVEITYTYLLSIARYGPMHWDFPKLHGGKIALILDLIVQMLQIFAKLWQIQILRMQYQMLWEMLGDVEEYRLIPYYVKI